VLQESEPEAELTVGECLSLYAGYYPAPRPVAETLDLVGLADRRGVRCGRLSAASAGALTWPWRRRGGSTCRTSKCTTPRSRTSISGIFIPMSELPSWLAHISYIFPVHPLAASLLAAYNPYTTGSGLNWGYLGILAAWGVVGLIVAVHRFRWLPREG
jgi:hypothetical protein